MIQKFLDKTFLRFLLVGMVNTAVGMSVMFIFYNVFHFGYWISSVSNYVIGSIVSYFLNKHFTFQNKSKDPAILVRFIVNISVCYLTAYGIAKPLVYAVLSGLPVSLQDNIAMLVGSGVFVILNYLGQRFFAFKPSSAD